MIEKKTVITFGTFDLFHNGHAELLKRASRLGQKLVVGISSDSLTYQKKGRMPALNIDQRRAVVREIRGVDEVFIEESLEAKSDYIQHYAADILVMGDDWRGAFDELRDLCQVVYLERTEGVSTTSILESVKDSHNGVGLKNSNVTRATNSTMIALFGYGRQGQRIHRLLENDPNVNVAMIIDPQNSEDPGIFDKFDPTAKQVDVAVTAVPHDQYSAILRDINAAGIHVVKEKPLGRNLAEARRFAHESPNGAVLLHRRANPIFRWVKENIEKVGELVTAQFSYTINAFNLDAGWRASKELSGGGALLDMGYHMFDLLSWWFPDISKVYAQTTYTAEDSQYDVEDSAAVVLRTSGGGVISLFLARKTGFIDESYLINGNKASMKFTPTGLELIDHVSSSVISRLEIDPSSLGENISRHLTDSIRQQGSWVPFSKAILTHEIIDAAYESSRRMTPVSVRDIGM